MVDIKKNAGLGFYVESAIGSCPTLSASNSLRFTRLVSEDLNSTFARDVSNEVRGDAQSGGSVITGVSGAGSISIQYSMETYDNLLAGLMFAYGTPDGDEESSGWTASTGNFAATGVAVTKGSDSWTLSGSTLTIESADVIALGEGDLVGTYVQFSKTGSAQMDGIWRVDAQTATTLTLESPGNSGGSNTVESYIGSNTISSATATITPALGVSMNGTQDRSFGFVRFYSDTSLSGQGSAFGLNACDAAVFRGAFVTSMQLSVAPGQAGWTGSLSTLFAGEESVTNALSAAPRSGFAMGNWNLSTPPNDNPLPDAILGVANVNLRRTDAGATDGERIDPLSLNMTISNNASEVNALRNAGAIAITQGTFSASIEMEVIYEDGTLHEAMTDNGTYEIDVACSDADGKAQLFRFPACKLTSERPNPGQNAPIVQKLSFLAEPGGVDYKGAAGAKTVEILRFYAGTLN